jgi:hypothetical protein
VGPRAGLGDVEKRIFLTLPGIKLRFVGVPTRSPVAIPTVLSRVIFVIFIVTKLRALFFQNIWATT